MRILFLEHTSFILLLRQTSCIEFAPARGSYVNVSAKTTQMVNIQRLDFSAPVLQKFRQF